MPRVRGVGIQDGSVLVVEAPPVVEAVSVVEAIAVIEAVLVVGKILLAVSVDAGAQWTNSKVRMKASSRKK